MSSLEGMLNKARNLAGSNHSPPHAEEKVVGKANGKKTGRPQMTQDNKKLVPLKVYCTKEESVKFKECCDKKGVSVSSTLRGYVIETITHE